MKIKTISGDKAFDAIKGRTVSMALSSTNSVDIHFTDGSFINIEVMAPFGGCSCSRDGNYCYCPSPEADINPYFSEAK